MDDFATRPDLPAPLKLVIVIGYAAIAAAALAAVIFLGPLAGDGFVALGDAVGARFGKWAEFAVLPAFVAVVIANAIWLRRRETRREYQRTRTITIEKRKPTPLWAKAALCAQGTLLAALIGMALGGFH